MTSIPLSSRPRRRHAPSSAIAPIALIALGIASSTGCAKDDPTKSAPASAAPPARGSASSAPKPSASAASRPVEGDAELVSLVEAVANRCELFVIEAMFHTCPAGEDRKLAERARALPPGVAVSTIVSYAMAREGDPKHRATAIAALKTALPSRDRKWLAANATPDAAARLVELLERVPESTVPGLGPVVAGVALTAGKKAELTAALEKKREGSAVRTEVYGHYLDYLGRDALAEIERLTKSKAPTERYRATSSVGIAVFDDPSGAHPLPAAEVKGALCDFAKRFVADPDAELAAGARDSMSRCAGPYIDAVLDDLEARLGKAPLDARQVEGIHRTCWSEVFVDRPANGTPEQCKRALGLMEKQAASKDAAADSLRTVAVNLGFMARFLDDSGRKRAKALLERLSKHPESAVRDAVRYSSDRIK